MAALRPIHYKKFERFLVKIGCHLVRQEGDHRVWDRENTGYENYNYPGVALIGQLVWQLPLASTPEKFEAAQILPPSWVG